MRITGSQVEMAASHSLRRQYSLKESLVFWRNGRSGAGIPAAAPGGGGEEGEGAAHARRGAGLWTGTGRPAEAPAGGGPAPTAGAVVVSDGATGATATLVQLAESGQEVELTMDEQDKQKLLVLQKMLEALTGKKIRFVLPAKIRLRSGNITNSYGPDGRPPSAAATVPAWGLVWRRQETLQEEENLHFQARGLVQTADGRQLTVELELQMSRRLAWSKEWELRAGAAAVDPLVINIRAPVAALTQEKFSFDLDCDGTAEQLSFVAPGSGFLALDLNGDGVINDGGELFGPATGDGFAELAVYDSDGNGWIDENDPVFQGLRIWTRDENGRDVLLALGQAGVGAIYLGHLSAAFDLRSGGSLAGKLRSSGLFLYEDGRTGTVQQVDLVV